MKINNLIKEEYISNMETEERCGHIVSKQIKQVWNIQIQMSLALLDICKQHNLKIWAFNGTMLGAVRHKGFIPWDDDIDFVMFRDDYDKLLEIAPLELEDPFHFQCAYNEQGYYRGHAQVRCSGTTMLIPGESVLGLDFNQGIFIDIFVADGLPDDKQDIDNLINLRNDILTYLWNRHYWRIKYSSFSNLRNFYKLKMKLGDKAQWDDSRLYSYLESLFRANSVKSHNYSCCLLFGYSMNSIRVTEMFEDTIWLPFEEILLPVPRRFDEVLSIEYGDYKQFIKGDSCHGSVIIDTDKSYTEYLPTLKRNHIQVLYYFGRSIVTEILRKLRSK